MSLRLLELICNSIIAGQSPCYNSTLADLGWVCVFVADAELGSSVAQIRCAGRDLSDWSEPKMNL